MKITNSMLSDKDLTQLECYYKIIEQLKSSIPQDTNHIVNIEFDNNDKIRFIHPLFIVCILNFFELLQTDAKYKRQDIRIILNIEGLDLKVQEYIHIYLTQYIDCNVIFVVDKTFKERNKHPSLFTNKKLLLYTSEKENSLTLLKKQKYNFLPIIKIANNTFNEDFIDKDYWITDKDTGKPKQISSFDNRKIFYKSLQLETIEEGAYKNKSDKVWTDIFETYLELTKNGAYITSKFKDIFREIIENIQKHTKVNDIPANGYISFYINNAKNLYELIVSDDYKNGFLHAYSETIKDEIKKEQEGSIAWKNYNNILTEFKNADYELILKNIFNLKYVLSAQSERMTKHFGMPLLLKIINQLKKLSKEKYSNEHLVSLEIYLNKDEMSFYVYNEDDVVKVKRLPNNVVQGTYFYLSFPEDLRLDNPVVITQEPLKLTSRYYKELLEDDKELLKGHFEKFEYYFDLKNNNNLDKKTSSVVIDYTNIDDTSNFLRDLYSFSFLNYVQDILVVNYPIEENIEYLTLLSESTDVSKICNIAFLNKMYPQVFFIGGNDHEDMCDINSMLSKTYNYNKRNFLDSGQIKDSLNLTSNLFYISPENKQMFFPFELFLPNPKSKDELFYTLMIDNFLELDENNEEIHLDLKDEFHIKKFYYLKYIFENSQWIKLLSYDLAKKIKKRHIKFENIIFVGIEKYSTLFLTELEYLLGRKIKTYIVSDLDSEPILKQFNEFKKLHTEKMFIFIRPSVFESKIDKLIEDLEHYEKYTLIELTKDDDETSSWIAAYRKNLSDVLEKASSCSLCFPSSGIDCPIYEIDKDKYNIKDLYHTHDSYKKNDKVFQSSWKNVIYFPHIDRNTNHYLYYVRTTQFLKNNINDIENYFKDIKFKKDNKVPVILTSEHNTNSEFVALINEVIFENDAIVHSLSLNNKEQGYFSIQNLNSTYKGKEKFYSFYFIDDAISSGEAFKYIYSVLSGFFEDKFQAVFTLIDRTNEKDLKLMNNFYKSEYFYSYVKINIHPIKTGFENCYLCDRKKTFENIANVSSLVTIKHTFQEKAKDLVKKKACEIEYQQLEEIIDLKNYLRMSSTEYIYQNIEAFNELENIKNQLDKYYKDVVRVYFQKNYLEGESITSEVDKFLEVESRIAFLKSLAFPKVYFFKLLRENVHKYIYKEIGNFVNLQKDDIKINPLLNDKDYNELDKIDKIRSLVSNYKEKYRTSMNYYSFLISIGSFLGINYILSYKSILYYYNLTLEIKKDNNYKYKNLLDMYPVSVKQLTTYSKEKSKYFEQELTKFYENIPFEYTRTFSRIFGLLVENTTHLNLRTKIFEDISKESTIDKQIDKIKITLEKLIETEVKSTRIKRIGIDINDNIEKPLMIDALNEYEEVENDSYEMKLYLGASIKKDIDYDTNIDIELRGEKYNIWCNFYRDFTTFIRITNSDENLTPMGVIVIEHKNTKLNEHEQLLEHLRVSRLILAYQNAICKLLITNNMLSSMRTKYDELSEKKSIEEKNKQISNSIHMINHTYRNYNKYSTFLMDIYNIDNKNIDDIKYSTHKLINYSRGIELHSILGSLNRQKFEQYKKDSNQANKNLTLYKVKKDSDIFIISKDFLSVCSDYIRTNPTLKKDAEYNFEVKEIKEFNIKYYNLCGITKDHINSIIFELVFNIIKQNCSGSDILITINENEVLIENTGVEIDKEKSEEFFKYNETSSLYSFGLGLPTIRETLSLFNIKIENTTPVNKKYNCCFRVYK
ncbi:ATP-binding protein [Halarcobacter sp.]|uniref:ATP-binding protein n=1 Tax=Halarcobacter sp. TaxID=2321133 RepID=UPI003A946A78